MAAVVVAGSESKSADVSLRNEGVADEDSDSSLLSLSLLPLLLTLLLLLLPVLLNTFADWISCLLLPALCPGKNSFLPAAAAPALVSLLSR